MAHKDPTDRAHIWERPARSDEAAPVETAPVEYEHELPRHVHKAGGESKIVHTPDDCTAALADGWSLRPPVEKIPAKK